jgi:general L-amino acid transport system permease protein
MTPSLSVRAAAWSRRNLFHSPASAAITVAMGVLLLLAGWSAFRWAVLDAVWTLPGASIADTEACRAAGVGACWAVVAEKHRFILFGLYPFEEQWRPALACVLFLLLFAATTQRRWWGWRIAASWIATLALVYLLLGGGVLGLAHVPENRWGGLPVTLLLTASGLLLAFPAAILIALGRMSGSAPLRMACLLFVEIVRGVPLISVLFLASVLFPLFLPDGIELSKLLRAQLAIVIFVAAYLSEIVRGGLQTLGKGQLEAAAALGLGYWQTAYLVRLPQALVAVIPPMVSLFIGFFKSTSLVMTIGIFDLLNAAKSAVAEPAWQGFGTEAYLFAGAIYFVFCMGMSRYGTHLERTLRPAR